MQVMNVRQLIEELQKYPPEMRVIVSGYEGGYCDTNSLEQKTIRLNVHKPSYWYYGPHDDAADYPLGDEEGIIETALLI
jgi:hypothetical protein